MDARGQSWVCVQRQGQPGSQELPLLQQPGTHSAELCLSRYPLSHGKAPSYPTHSTWQACFPLSEPISGKGYVGVLRWLSPACFQAAELQACGELPNETVGGKCSHCLLAFFKKKLFYFIFFSCLPSPLNLLALSFF